MLKKTSPQISVRSLSRQNDTWPGLWPGRVEHDEPVAELVALAQLARGLDGGRAGEAADLRDGRVAARRDRRGAVAQVRRVGGADPDRHAERLVHVLGAARVVVVDVRQRVRAHLVPATAATTFLPWRM